jgi:hypothetical protein
LQVSGAAQVLRLGKSPALPAAWAGSLYLVMKTIIYALG